MEEKQKIPLLIVDDRKANLVALENLLENPELEIVTAQSGNEALGLMLDYDFALVLLDVQMPQMNGFEVAELMRSKKKTRNIPIIFITAINKAQNYVFSGYEEGAVDYIFKPLEPLVIRSKVNVFVQLFKQKQALEKALAEKEILLKEVHHRVKNSLTMIASFISLQADYMEQSEGKRTLEELQKKVEAISIVHEKLYQSPNISEIAFDDYISEIIDNIIYSSSSPSAVDIVVDSDKIKLRLEKALPLGLIITELVTNALKYAFIGSNSGRVLVQLKEGERISLRVEDNGVGMPEDLDVKATNSLGLILVNSLVQQIHGDLKLERSKGSTFIITFAA